MFAVLPPRCRSTAEGLSVAYRTGGPHHYVLDQIADHDDHDEDAGGVRVLCVAHAGDGAGFEISSRLCA
jgi:hypothetical protein